MSATRLGGALLAVLIAAPAAHASPAFALGDLSYSKDSAGFEVKGASLGAGFYTSDANFIDRFAYRRSAHEFSAPGYAGRASTDALMAARMFGTVKAEAELSRFRLKGGPASTLGAAQLSGQAREGISYEARFEKNIVESAASLANGVTYSAYTVAADYEVTPRFILAGQAGRFDFSDDNRRNLLKAKAIYVVSEDLGLSVYAKARGHTNSRSGSPNYFSPDDFKDYMGGIRFRRRVGALHGIASGYVEAGRQDADGEGTSVQGWQLRLESFPNKPWHYDFSIGIQNSSEGAAVQARRGEKYKYRYLRASAVWPF